MSSTFAARLLRAAPLALAFFGVAAVAQRPTPEFKVKDRRVMIEYGAVPSGKHSLDELQVGSTWRMGSNSGSVFATDLPVIAGDRLIAPGGYGANMARTGDREVEFNVVGASLAFGGGGGGGIGLPGTLKKLDKAAKKLDIQLPSGGKDEPGVKLAKIVLEFGSERFEAPLTVVAAKTAKAGEWTADVFTYPAEFVTKRLEAGTPTPLAVLRRPDPVDAKKTLAFNVFVTKEQAKLVPWMTPPTANRGLGDPTAPDSAAIKEGKAEWAAAQKKTATVESEKVEFKKGEGFTFRLVCGEQTCVATVPDPLAKK
jgi:hypothetical protein